MIPFIISYLKRHGYSIKLSERNGWFSEDTIKITVSITGKFACVEMHKHAKSMSRVSFVQTNSRTATTHFDVSGGPSIYSQHHMRYELLHGHFFSDVAIGIAVSGLRSGIEYKYRHR